MCNANNTNFRLTPNQEKNNDKIFRKTLKFLIFGYCRPICPILGKNKFSQKKGSVTFLNLQLSTIMQKLKQNILMSGYQEKLLTDRLESQQTDFINNTHNFLNSKVKHVQ